MSLAEDIAAVSAQFHASERYREFYDVWGPALSGFPGIWTFCALAGIALRNVEVRLDMVYDDGWIEVINNYVDRIYSAALGYWDAGTEDTPKLISNTPQDVVWLEQVAELAVREFGRSTSDLPPPAVLSLRAAALSACGFQDDTSGKARELFEYEDSDGLLRLIEASKKV